MALEGALENVRPDGALSAGKKWPGVWTRDFADATDLGLAMVLPEACKRSFAAKVNSTPAVIQDTGTGGAGRQPMTASLWDKQQSSCSGLPEMRSFWAQRTLPSRTRRGPIWRRC